MFLKEHGLRNLQSLSMRKLLAIRTNSSNRGRLAQLQYFLVCRQCTVYTEARDQLGAHVFRGWPGQLSPSTQDKFPIMKKNKHRKSAFVILPDRTFFGLVYWCPDSRLRNHKNLVTS